jgi:beta-glucanase (GH16 family)
VLSEIARIIPSQVEMALPRQRHLSRGSFESSLGRSWVRSGRWRVVGFVVQAERNAPMFFRRLPFAVFALSLSALVLAAPFDASLIEDFDQFPWLWKASPNVTLDNPAIAAGDPLALPGQGAVEHVLSATGPQRVAIEMPRHFCRSRFEIVPVVLLTTNTFNAANADPRTITLGNAHALRFEHRFHNPPRPLIDVDRDGDRDLVLFFQCGDTGLPRDPDVVPFNGQTFDGKWFSAGGANASFVRSFAASTDWSTSDGLRFWYYGRNTGDTLDVQLLDNRAPDPGPSGWRLVWNDEFSGPAGQLPNPKHWTPEIGDGTAQGIPGWGNNELEYYTGNAENASTDGRGHLAINLRKADGSLSCWYGPCQYTSARLISQYKAEAGHGRIEARVKVPAGAGLWPAFWALGSNIGQVGWPTCGEIDMMEFVGKNPTQVSGTLHGPGYSGGGGISKTYDLGTPVSDAYHIFALEWQADRLDWSIDGVVFHSVTRADLAGKQWVFDKPFFIIMNLAVGGNLGGPVGDDVTFPKSLLIDYVRVFQARDTAERFEASFTDNFSGWQEVALPWGSFGRSARQPLGAPDDGLTLSEVWGYGVRMPDNGLSAGPVLMDKVHLIKPAAVVVKNLNDSGSGSLRNAADAVADGGSITFNPSLAGGTVALSSGPLWITGKSLTIDGAAAPGLTVSGSNRDRVLIVDPGATVSMSHLTLANGWAWDLAGGVLNNGNLNLNEVVVANNVVNASAGDWWKGGGGIYTGGGSILNVANSTISGNQTAFVSGGSGSLDGGGLYVFQNATLHIDSSTLNGNTSANVGGGIRMLGTGTIVNSTLSGNTSVGWYGSAVFHTDGSLGITNSTITGNVAPPWAPAALFVGTFTPANATLTLTNNIVANNQDIGCFPGYFGPGTVILASGGHNLSTDATCYPAASDVVVGDAGLLPLADNGGPTLTHALQPSSPAIDAADPALCPSTDQRGVARPQGAGCDIGSVEQE